MILAGGPPWNLDEVFLLPAVAPWSLTRGSHRLGYSLA